MRARKKRRIRKRKKIKMRPLKMKIYSTLLLFLLKSK